MSEAAAPGGREPVLGALRPMSDDRLARRATKGDRRAFAAIYNRYHQSLYRFCLAIVGNPQDAQDALQNTMVKVLRALPGEKRRIQLKPWLYRIAHNEAVELLRRRRPAEHIDPETAVAAAWSPAESVEHRERLRRLLADLEELPDRQRGALVMRELAGLSFAQIGAAFETSDAVARQTVYEARLSLRQMAEGREMSCKRVMWELSAADGRVRRRRDVQAHLRACPECRAFGEEIAGRHRDLAAIAPLPVAAAAGLLHGLLGGNAAAAGAGIGAAGAGTGAGTASGGGLAGTVAVGAGKTVATSAIVKSAATVAVVAVVGASAADRGGLIETPLPSSIGGAKSSQSTQPDAGAMEPGGTQSSRGAAAGTAIGGGGRQGSHAGVASAKGKPEHGNSGNTAAGGAKSHGHSASENAPGAAPNSGHGPPEGLPAASSHGQQTAASHGGGHSSNPHPHSQGQRSPSPHAGSNAKAHSHKPHHHKAHPHPHPHPPHPSPQAGQVGPDNSPATPLQPLKPPTNQGASGNASAHSSKEAR